MAPKIRLPGTSESRIWESPLDTRTPEGETVRVGFRKKDIIPLFQEELPVSEEKPKHEEGESEILIMGERLGIKPKSEKYIKDARLSIFPLIGGGTRKLALPSPDQIKMAQNKVRKTATKLLRK
jgi:hypothetical protein